MINEEEAERIENEDEGEKNLESEEAPAEERPEEKDILTRINELQEELEKKSDKSDIEEIKGWRAEFIGKFSSIQKEIEELRKEDERVLSNFREFTDIITKKNDDINRTVEQKVDETKLKQFRKDMSKIDKKLNLLMEETGFGEILDVAKIPPNILEIVYDTTLADVAKALWQEYGPGAEKIIIDVLEDIRLETSGSEMFYFDGRRIRTRDVAKNIRRGMISARQLQDTYEELLKKLLENVPGHKSKNFRAMIKLKSQEYTVDKTTFLLERVEKMENTVLMLNGMVSGLANNVNRETERMAEELKKLSAEVERKLTEDANEREKRLQSIEKKIEALRRESESRMLAMTETLEKKMLEKEEEMRTRMEALEEKVFPEERLKPEKKGKKTRRSKPAELSDEERFVYSAVPAEGISLTKLRKSTESIIQTPLNEIVRSLLEKGMLNEERKGRSVRYSPAVEGEKEKSEEKETKKRAKKPEKRKSPKKSRKKPEKEKIEEATGSEKRERASKKKITGNEAAVLDVIPENGCTLNRLKKELEDRMQYEELLDTVKELVEKEFMVITTRGRHTIYMKNEEKIGGEKNA